ncbi:hypothetical protein [Brachybacterium paraconglomeratum]|uniref:hypothetical protein n=1 Tax=Brachybacterium paraconglomeratum TaxID=173362 RepID=UPI0031F1303F
MTTSSPETHHFRPLTLHKVALWLIAVAVVIVVIALVFLLAHQRTTGVLSQNLHTVFWYFDVGREYNMATWYNSGLWLLMGALSAAIAVARSTHRRSWWLLTAVALFASVDEYLEVHERLDLPADRLFERLPFDLGFSWVLLGAPIALVIGLLLLRLVLALPARARNGLILGGALFLLGAIGVESVNGMILAGNDHIVDNAFIYGTMVEELLEMSGVAVAFASLLSLFQHDARNGTLRLDPTVLPPLRLQERASAPR